MIDYIILFVGVGLTPIIFTTVDIELNNPLLTSLTLFVIWASSWAYIIGNVLWGN